MRFEDNAPDVVMCMGVLEHLEVKDFNNAVRELRRVARNKLIMSAPFEEENLPAYHKQRFTRKGLAKTFPDAEIKLLVKPQPGVWPWAFIIENSPQS